MALLSVLVLGGWLPQSFGVVGIEIVLAGCLRRLCTADVLCMACWAGVRGVVKKAPVRTLKISVARLVTQLTCCSCWCDCATH